jgi:hypothetical protein
VWAKCSINPEQVHAVLWSIGCVEVGSSFFLSAGFLAPELIANLCTFSSGTFPAFLKTAKCKLFLRGTKLDNIEAKNTIASLLFKTKLKAVGLASLCEIHCTDVSGFLMGRRNIAPPIVDRLIRTLQEVDALVNDVRQKTGVSPDLRQIDEIRAALETRRQHKAVLTLK